MNWITKNSVDNFKTDNEEVSYKLVGGYYIKANNSEENVKYVNSCDRK